MGQDTSAFDACLKEVYVDGVREQINQNTKTLDMFTEGDVTQYEWEGRQVLLDLHKTRNVGVKAVAEGGILPSAGKQGYANMKIPMRLVYGRIELTAAVMKAARSNKGSFIRAMDSEQKSVVDDISRQRNRYLCYANKGTLALVSSGANSATQTLKDPGGVAGSVNPTRFIQPGMVLAFTDTSGVAITSGIRTVSSVDPANSQVTLDQAINTTTGNLVSFGQTDGSTLESSFELEPMGLLGIVDASTYVSTFHNIDRSNAANAWFRSTIMSNVGALSPDLIQRGIDNCEEVSGEVIEQFVTHSSVRREMMKLTEADRRYTAAALMSPDAGQKAGVFKADLTFNGLPVKVEKDWAYGIMVGVNKSHLIWLPETKGEWADDDGSILGRVKDKDSYEARFRLFENFTTDKCRAHVRYDGITATVTSGVYSD